MERHGTRLRVLVAAAALLLVALQAHPAADGAPPADAAPPEIAASVAGTPVGQAMPSGFVGVSMEYKAIHAYTGRDPRTVNPELVALLRGLAPGQAPVLRIGGDSTDWTWWPVRGAARPGGVSYNLGKGWVRTTRALAASLGAKLILGINLATARPALASDEAQALLQGIGRRYVSALEIGNEPDLYGVFAWYRDRLNHVIYSRHRDYSMKTFMKDFAHWRAALPALPLVGPSFSRLTWMNKLPGFLKQEPRVKTVTVHRYPLHGSTTDPADPTYPTIANLMTDAAAQGVAQQVAPYARQAHNKRLKFRVDEMNSVSSAGRFGVSDTFSSALWILDTLFNLASVGVDGVNLHTLPGAGYELFTFTHTGSTWSADVHPEYYGAYMFAQAFPPRARLLPVTIPSGPVKVWATQGTDGHTRITLINKEETTPVSVKLTLPSDANPAQLQQLSAPSLASTSGVTFDGQTFGSITDSQRLALTPRSSQVEPSGGAYTVTLPAGSAALLTQ